MRPLAAIGLAVAALGVIALAAHQGPVVHAWTARTPDGGVERTFAIGDAPPDVYGEDPALGLARMQAAMDREARAMSVADGLSAAALPVLAAPGADAGVSGTSVVTTVTNGHVCTRRTDYGPKGAVTRVSGDCAAADAPAAPMTPAAPAARPVPAPGARTLAV